jgi:hypothetical protein
MSSATATSSDTRPAGRDRRRLLVDSIRLDAAVSGAAGLLLAAGAPLLDGALGPEPAVLLGLGLFLVAYAAGLFLLARVGAPAAGVKAVIAGNALWVVASVVTVFAGWLDLTALGVAFALLQAAVVALLAELQLIALRRSR